MPDDERYSVVLRYHDRTKHHFDRYARSLGYMDWANQPNPFRSFDGAQQIPLPLAQGDGDSPYCALCQTRQPTDDRVGLADLARFLELSLGLSAWKRFGASEWSLRMNPSSGNLHPTECYLLLPPLDAQPACVAHYHPLLHRLEIRSTLPQAAANGLRSLGGFGLILSSICWREAWKYGERAFRYCNHDVGHALGALRFSAGLLGWKLSLQTPIADQALNRLLGFDSIEWPDGEAEHADCLCWVSPREIDAERIARWLPGLETPDYVHRPNRLSAHHAPWPVIEEVGAAARSPGFAGREVSPRRPAPTLVSRFTAEQIIRNRRSAQAYDPETSHIELPQFLQILERTLPSDLTPFDSLPLEANVHLALFVHQVEGLAPGLYLLVRNDRQLAALQSDLDAGFTWQQVDERLPLYRLRAGDLRELAGTISCQQAIAADSAFSLGMLARFEPVLAQAPWRYPRLFWESGLIGQVLYLEAEAHGLRGTGIGCFFDEAMHDLLGVKDHAWQDLYHFTVGMPVDDPRIQTKPAYHHLQSEPG